jgi:hypothetical protein
LNTARDCLNAASSSSERTCGIGLRIKWAELDEKISEMLGMLVLVPVLITTNEWFIRSQSFWAVVGIVPFSIGFMAWLGFRFFKVARERDD